MPRNIMDALNIVPDGKRPKNPFDLSNFETFHQKGGQINVVGVRDCMPNADYKMSVDGYTRSQLCNTANFARIKENYYFVYVPLALLNRAAYQMEVQRKQEYSAISQGIQRMPTFKLSTVLKRCLEIAHLDLSLTANQKFKDVHGFNIGREAFKLFDMLGYGCYLDIVEATFRQTNPLSVSDAKTLFDRITFSPTANRLAAYQCVWYHFFRNDIYDNNVTAKCFNFDDVTLAAYGQEPTSNYDILTTRSVDDFIIDCCQLRYVGYKKDIFMGSMPGTQYGAVSTVSLGNVQGLTAQFVGTAAQIALTGANTNNGSLGQDSVISVGRTFVDAYSGDSVSENTRVPLNNFVTEVIDHGGAGKEVYGKPQVTFDNGSGGYVFRDAAIMGTAPAPLVSAGDIPVSVSGSYTPQGTVNLSGSSAGTAFDVLSLVEAQAIQKWRQKSMLAGNKTVDQFRAHHGEVPRHLVDHLPDFIGSVDNEIQITEITSHSDTATSVDESNLGEIRGRGYGVTENKTFDFHSTDYGVLLLLHAIVPENTYSSYGLDFGNSMIYYNDFYQGEYMNIGLQSVPLFMLNSLDTLSQSVPSAAHLAGGDIFAAGGVGIGGLAPRYFQYKQYPSHVHGMFNPSRLALYNPDYTTDIFGYDDMQSFVMPRADLVIPLVSSGSIISPTSQFLTMTLSKLYVNPVIFDSIFAVNADDSETTDTFFSHVRFECEALQPLSVLGLPQF